MLEVRNLSFETEHFQILKNITFSANAGEIIGLMGANGSGKSTLLKCLVALLRPNAHTLKINGIPQDTLSTSKLAKLIAYVPQEHKPPFPFSLEEIVLMGRSPYLGGIFKLKNDDYLKAEAAMEQLGILELRRKAVTLLSGGERQLALIARAITQDAPILILDEPTSALDFNHQILVWKVLENIAKSGKLVLICSHDPNHLLWFASRTIALKNGEILAFGKTSEVINKKHLRDIYHNDYHIKEFEGKSVILPIF